MRRRSEHDTAAERAPRRSAPRSDRLIATVVCAAVALGCTAWRGEERPPEGWQKQLAAAPPAPPGPHFPLPAPELERVLREDFEIRSSEPAGSGIMGALKIEAFYPSIERTLELKWKAAPSGGDGWNNTPRREIAAYAIQKWFLRPTDYVVPPTVARCIALDAYAAIDPDVEANVADARCVFGMLATWLDEVEELDPEVDEERFYRDAYYARHLANYNLLTYLIQNRDTRRGNLLVSTDASNPRVFSIDNGITFGEWLYNFFLPQWDVLFVPAVPRDSIERLRSVGEEELRALAAVAQFRRDAGGVLRETSVSGVFDAEQGARMKDGVLQLGLVPAEIDGVRDRLAALLADVERGEIDVF